MVKLQYDSNGQFKITMPKQLLVALGWGKGDTIAISVEKADELIIRRQKSVPEKFNSLSRLSKSKERLRQR